MAFVSMIEKTARNEGRCAKRSMQCQRKDNFSSTSPWFFLCRRKCQEELACIKEELACSKKELAHVRVMHTIS